MSNSTDNIKTLSDALAEAAKDRKQNRDAYTNIFNQRLEYLRQITVAQNEGRANDISNLMTKFVGPLTTQLDNQAVNVKNSEAAFDAAQKAFDEAIKNLTPEQKETIASENKVAVANAEAAANATATEKAKLQIQGTTKYLIIGGIILVLIFVGIMIYKKRFAA